MVASSLIRVESERPGTLSWMPQKLRIVPGTGRCPWIEGWCSQLSATSGDAVEFFVSADPPSAFTIDLYRMGYYQGTGARLMTSLGPLEGRSQAVPEPGGMRVRECRWQASARVTIPDEWLSGVYVGKLTRLDDGIESYLVFVVRDQREADLLVQCSDFTWHAYNTWPVESSMYDHDEREHWDYWGPDTAVSFDRPLDSQGGLFAPGASEFFQLEFPFHYWLERNGYDVTYCSNLDTHRGTAEIGRVRGFLSIGHDEYYTLQMYERLMSAVGAGTSIGFFSGNTCCGRLDLRAGTDGREDRVISRMDRFGPRNAAEIRVLPDIGQLPHESPDEALLIGARTTAPIMGVGGWVCSAPAHWCFEGTRMQQGDSIPNLVGFEWHADPADIPGLEIVSTGETSDPNHGPGTYTATVYLGPKGNVVFNASSVWWSSGLSVPPGFLRPMWEQMPCAAPDPRAQRITANVLDRMVKGTPRPSDA